MSTTPATVDHAAAAANSADTKPALVVVYLPTSGASRRVDGFLAQVLQHRANHATFQLFRVNADQRPDLLERLQVTDIPTLLVIAQGRIRGRLSKPTGCTQITRLLTPWLR